RTRLGPSTGREPIEAEDFLAIGALGRGGLSRIWGAFVCELQDDDLQGWPLTAYDLRQSYDAVVARIGVSGSHDDDMAAFYGYSDALQMPPPLGPTAAAIFKRYSAARPDPEFALGRARNALITENRWQRQSCDLKLACLWGYGRGAIDAPREGVAM